MDLTLSNPRGEAMAMTNALDQHIADNHNPFWEPSIQRLAKLAKVSLPWPLALVARWLTFVRTLS